MSKLTPQQARARSIAESLTPAERADLEDVACCVRIRPEIEERLSLTFLRESRCVARTPAYGYEITGLGQEVLRWLNG